MALMTEAASIKLDADVLFARLLPGGIYGELVKIANATEFSIQPQSSTESIIGTERLNAGQTLDTLVEANDLLITLAANRFNGRSLALALMGNENEILAGSGTVEDELVGIVNGQLELSRERVSAVVVRGLRLLVDDETGFSVGEAITIEGSEVGVIAATATGQIDIFFTGTLPEAGDSVTNGSATAVIDSGGVADLNTLAVLDTDYSVFDADLGVVRTIADGTMDVPALTKVKVNYTWTKTVGSEIVVAANIDIKGKLVIKGKNKVNLKRVYVNLREVTMAPNAAIPLMGDERSVVTWQGTASTPAGADDPGTVELGQ